MGVQQHRRKSSKSSLNLYSKLVFFFFLSPRPDASFHLSYQLLSIKAQSFFLLIIAFPISSRERTLVKFSGNPPSKHTTCLQPSWGKAVETLCVSTDILNCTAQTEHKHVLNPEPNACLGLSLFPTACTHRAGHSSPVPVLGPPSLLPTCPLQHPSACLLCRSSHCAFVTHTVWNLLSYRIIPVYLFIYLFNLTLYR